MSDLFGTRCQARARHGRRCSRRVRVTIPYSSKAEVELAVASGWPMMLPGMVPPKTVGEHGFCSLHGGRHLDDEPVKMARGFCETTRDYKPSAESRASQQARLKKWQDELPAAVRGGEG